ncbi:MAG: 1-deoxy-D-xylulose-5-phosphate reductoisomerase, partial [Alphaproteobacteria bacterium]|nr:1-deoxy-D-xylulose-5-phosphate reductoisomerase [Alphaproteobacteria bacterium]
AAMRAGGLMPTILNGANEVAVAAFLDGHIGFTDIADYVEAAMESADRHGQTLLADDFEAALAQIIACDFQTRENTGHLIAEKRAK